MKPTKTFISGYVSKETDAELNAFAESLNRDARKYGGRDGREHKPALDALDLTPNIGQFTAAVTRLCMSLLGNMKFAVHKAAYERFQAEHLEKVSRNKKRIADLRHENEIDGGELNAAPKPKHKKIHALVYLICAFVFFGEAYFNSLAFMSYGGGVIGDYALGALVALAEGAISFFIGKSVADMQADGKKRYVQITLLALVNLGIITAMSVLRANVVASETSIAIPAWVFFLINIALVVGAVALSRMFFPSEAQTEEARTRLHRYNVLAEKIEARNKEIAKLEAENAASEKEATEKQEQYLVITGQAEYVAKFLDSTHLQAIATYKAENMRERTDGIPECFRLPVAPLNLFTTFNS